MGWITDLLAELPISAVQRERLTLEMAKAAAKQEVLERQLSDLQAERDQLKSAAEQHASEAQALQAEIAEIRRLQDEADKKRQQESFDPVAETLLKLVCYHDGNSTEYVAGLAGVSAQVARFHLEAMESRRLVRSQHYASTLGAAPECDWSVTPAGRTYLMERGLLV